MLNTDALLEVGEFIECLTGLYGIRYEYKGRPFWFARLSLHVNQAWRPAELIDELEARFLIRYEMPSGREYFHEWRPIPLFPFFEFSRSINANRPPHPWREVFAARETAGW